MSVIYEERISNIMDLMEYLDDETTSTRIKTIFIVSTR